MSTPDHALIQAQASEHLLGSRTQSAALLAWFLHAVWRLELEDVSDAVCDGGGDKGIDALVVNPDEITVLQAKHHTKPDGQQGDKDIKNLFGAAAYFRTPETVQGLLDSKPNEELRRLVTRQKVKSLVAEGAAVTRMVFVTDGTLDRAGQDFVAAMKGHEPELEVWDQGRLAAVARRTVAPELRPVTVKLHAAAAPTETHLGSSKLAVALISAKELVSKLPDIGNLLLFDRNVRLSEGRTRVNRELADTIRKPTEHGFFPAYHNGITALTHGLTVKGSTLVLDHVTVVNGCQSLLALNDNKASLTDDLKLLVKVVEVPKGNDLIEKITYRSNNQNPVDIRDQRSTDVVQRGLQRAVQQEFGSAFGYVVREGEKSTATEVLDNQEAAQLLMAVYLREPWTAVRKVRLFDNDYRRIFDRNVTAARLYLLRQVADVVENKRARLRADLAASFASIRFTLAHLLASAIKESQLGQALFEDPARWLPDKRAEVRAAFEAVLNEIVDSVNFYIDEEEAERRENDETFDPKVTFKSYAGVTKVENAVLRDFRRLTKRDPSYLFDISPARA